VSSAMVDGVVPYRDFLTDYPPMAMLIHALPRLLSDEVSFGVDMAINMAFQLGTAILVAVVASKWTKQRSLWVLGAVITLVWMWRYDGYRLELEPMVICCTLAALLLLCRPRHTWQLVAAGVILGFAVAVKQYGAIPTVILIGALFLTGEGTWWDRGRQAAVVSISVMSLLGLVVAGFWLSGVSPALMLSQLHPGTYVGEGFPPLGYRARFLSQALWLLAVPALFLIPQWRQNRLFLLVCVLTLGFSSTLYIREFPHYFIQIIPFSSLFLVVLLEAARQSSSRALTLASCIFSLLMLPFLLDLSGLLAYRLLLHEMEPHEAFAAHTGRPRQRVHLSYTGQRQVCAQFRPCARENQPVLVISNPAYHAVCGYWPPTPELGFRFTSRMDPHLVAQALSEGPKAIIVEPAGLDYDRIARRFQQTIGTDLTTAMKEAGFTAQCEGAGGEISVWTKK
ncbi:MAG: hypothetical protein HN348_29915, partial [Proteobacteria bacterium]|nr:hypothetical protein [Pseudomonadota bacterium]